MIEHYLKELISQGITFIPRWSPPAVKDERALAVARDPGDILLDSGAAGTSREQAGSPCPPPEAASPDGRHCPGSSSQSVAPTKELIFISLGIRFVVWSVGEEEGKLFSFFTKNKQWSFFFPKTKKLCSQYVLELRKKIRLDQLFKVFYTLNWRRCFQYGIKYFISSKINILGGRFGWFLALYQAKTNFVECLLKHFSHKMPESNFIFLCVGLMISSRLNKILLWQKEIGGTFESRAVVIETVVVIPEKERQHLFC